MGDATITVSYHKGLSDAYKMAAGIVKKLGPELGEQALKELSEEYRAMVEAQLSEGKQQ